MKRTQLSPTFEYLKPVFILSGYTRVGDTDRTGIFGVFATREDAERYRDEYPATERPGIWSIDENTVLTYRDRVRRVRIDPPLDTISKLNGPSDDNGEFQLWLKERDWDSSMPLGEMYDLFLAEKKGS